MAEKKKIATRDAYGAALSRLVQQDKNIMVLDADLSGSTKTKKAQDVCPKQFYNMGIAEGNMMGVAAGLAASGHTVFASSFAMFATGRAYEQIRNSIGYPQMNVKVCASHAGITVGEDGASHQSIEDIAIMREIPGMRVICPADAVVAEKVIEQVAKIDGPCYVRLGRSAVDVVYDETVNIEVGKGNVLEEGKDVCIVACGIMVEAAMQACEILKAKGYTPTLVDMHTIKPIDVELLDRLAQTHELFVTCEEHSIIGGLGSAVCEALAETTPRKVKRVGILDTFGESGTPAELLAKYNCTKDDIVKAVEHNLKK